MKRTRSSRLSIDVPRASAYNLDEELFMTDDEYNPASSLESACDPLDFTQKPVRKRKRKSNAQIKVLKAEFEVDPHWTKERITALSAKTGLSEGQIYKWSWDYRKKLKDSGGLSEYSDTLACKEVLAPSLREQEEYDVVLEYRKAWSACFRQSPESSVYMPRKVKL